MAPSTPSIGDPDFDQVVVGAGNFQYDPTGSPWAFSGSSGISGNNSGFTSGNPPAPQGSQVAFIQTTGSFSQSVAGWAAGSYVLTFDAAQRENYLASHQNFNVLIDGSVVGTFTPSGTSYQSYSTPAFTVAAGTHTITFEGLDSAGGDNTAFLDQVAVAPASTPSIGDPDFDQVVVGAGNFQYDPTGSPWAFSGSSGISGNNSGFTSGNPPAPQGSQVAFIQTTGSFSQSVAGWAAGSYVLTFDAAQRENYLASHQNFNVLIDGSVVGTFTPSGTSSQSYSTPAFTVAAGTHTITFQGLDSAGGDNTAFVDAISLAPAGTVAGGTVSITPTVLTTLITNPGMGLESMYGTKATDHNNGTLNMGPAYTRYYWSQVEPSEGDFAFTQIVNDYNAAQAQGQDYCLRIEPYDNQPGGSGPAWLEAEGASGYTFNAEGGPNNWAPNMSDPTVMAEYQKLIQALGARFDGLPASVRSTSAQSASGANGTITRRMSFPRTEIPRHRST